MRIPVMLNPTNRYGTKMAYTELRRFFINDGYQKKTAKGFHAGRRYEKKLYQASKQEKIIFAIYRRSKNADFDGKTV